MGIEKFFKQDFTLSEEITAKVGGVNKQTLSVLGTFKGILDPAATTRIYDSAKDTFIIVNKLFSAYTVALTEGTVVTYNSIDYDVISPIDPLSKNHHLETIIRRRD